MRRSSDLVSSHVRVSAQIHKEKNEIITSNLKEAKESIIEEDNEVVVEANCAGEKKETEWHICHPPPYGTYIYWKYYGRFV